MTDWASACLDELDRLQGDHAHKKRNTVIALVDARLAGRSEETVWNLATTCSRNTWHSKWKHDPLLMDVLANVERKARRWTDTRAIRALQDAAEKLMLASPAVADQLVKVATGNYADATAADVVRAGLGVLDRAGVETAPKTQLEHGLSPELESLLERVYGEAADETEDEQ